MSLIVVAVWGYIFGLAIFAPSLVLLLYGIVGAERDGYADLQVMSLVMAEHKLITHSIIVWLYSGVFVVHAKLKFSVPNPESLFNTCKFGRLWSL